MPRGHDFAITMLGGNSRICRICETSEFQERMFDDIGTQSLIKEIWPASQTIAPIFEKILTSEFAGKSQQDARGRAYHRSQGFGLRSHDLRECGCDFCARDRMAFQDAIESLLTSEESELLSICDRLHHRITSALEEASVDMMEAWARAAGLNDEQTRALMRHHGGCPNTKDELIRATQTLEGEFGYLMHALGEFGSCWEMIEDQVCQMIMSRLSLFRMRRQDEGEVVGTVLPVVEKTANKLVMAWEEEAGGSNETLPREQAETQPGHRSTGKGIGDQGELGTPPVRAPRQEQFQRTTSASPQFLCGEHSGDWAGAALPERVRGGSGLYTSCSSGTRVTTATSPYERGWS